MAVTVDTGKTGIASNIQVLAKSAVAVSGAADLLENVLATITVPAGSMGPNGALRIWTIWSVTNNANNKTFRIRFGGAAGTAYLAQVLTTLDSFADVRWIQNRGAANSQVGTHPWLPVTTTGGPTATTSSVDTGAATTIVITGEKAVAGDTLRLESYLVELIPG